MEPCWSLLGDCDFQVSAAKCEAHGRRLHKLLKAPEILVSTKNSKVDTVTESNFPGGSADKSVLLVYVDTCSPLVSAAP